MSRPWEGLKVLELPGLASSYATRLWAGLGADVVVAESGKGHPYRAMAPFAGTTTGPEGSLWWAFIGQGKRSVVVDEDGVDALRQAADVVISDLDHADPEHGGGVIEAAHAQQVAVVISPFGLTGPRSRWRSSDLVAWSSAGLSFVTGFPDSTPVAPAPKVQLAAHITGMNAVIAAMMALHARRRSGSGQRVDISMHECCLALSPECGVTLLLDDGVKRVRTGNRRAVSRPFGLYPCRDGHISLIVVQPAHWRRTAQWIIEVTGAEGVDDPAFDDLAVRWEAADFIDGLTEDLTRSFTKLELFQEGQRRGIPITPVTTIADLRNDPHLAATGFWRQHQHPVLGELTCPGEPFRADNWWAWERAPLLGEHNDAVSSDWQVKL